MASTPEKSSGVQAVVFDLGGVLIDWDPRRIFKHCFATHGVMEAFVADVFWRAHKACHDSDASFHEVLAPFRENYPHYDAALVAMAEHWDRALMGPIPETVALVEELASRNVSLYALTNWPAQTWPPRGPGDVEYDFLSMFEGIVVSGQVKLAKPDPQIYALAMEQFGLSVGDALFVDDLAVNAEAAGAAGLVGHQFISADHLRSRLVDLGLL